MLQVFFFFLTAVKLSMNIWVLKDTVRTQSYSCSLRTAEKQLHSPFFHLTQKMLPNMLQSIWSRLKRIAEDWLVKPNLREMDVVTAGWQKVSELMSRLYMALFLRLRLLISQICNLGIVYLLLLLVNQTPVVFRQDFLLLHDHKTATILLLPSICTEFPFLSSELSQP